MTSRTKAGTSRILVVLGAGMALLVLAFVLVTLRARPPDAVRLRDQGVFLRENPQPLRLEGLRDQHSQPFGRERLEGRWSLLFFGFTHCNNICPVVLAEMAAAAPVLRQRYPKTQLVLVSVDPRRDTPQRLGSYLGEFGVDMVGVTGSERALRLLAEQFAVAWEPPLERSGDYQVVHGGTIALVDDSGAYRGFLKPPFAAPRLGNLYRDARIWAAFQARRGS